MLKGTKTCGVIVLIIFAVIFGGGIFTQKGIAVVYNIGEVDRIAPYTFEKVGQLDDRFGVAEKFILKDELAYLACSWTGLVIVNITDLANPYVISTLNPVLEGVPSASGEISNLFMFEEYLLLIDDGAGVLAIDVSDPHNPFLVSKWEEIRYFYVFVYKEQFGFSILNREKVIIYDLNNIQEPVIHAELSFEENDISDLVVVDDYLFIISIMGIIVMDITDPSAPTEIGLLEGMFGTKSIAFENFLLIGTRYGINIINVTNPREPKFIEYFDLGADFVGSICYAETTVYVSDTEVIYTLDMKNITDPISLGNNSAYIFGWGSNQIGCNGMNYGKEVLFCLDRTAGLFILNTTDPVNLKEISYLNTGKKAKRVVIQGEYAYLTSHPEIPGYPAQLEIVSIIDQQEPKLMGTYQFTQNSIMDLEVRGQYAYLSLAGKGLVVLDISDPNQPEKICELQCHNGSIYPSTIYYDLWYHPTKDIVYLTQGWLGVHIINVTNPETPVYVRNFDPMEDHTSTIEGDGDLMVIAGGARDGEWNTGGVMIVNISIPTNPVQLSTSFGAGDVYDVAIHKNRLYVNTDDYMLRMYDIANPAEPTYIASYNDGHRFASHLEVDEEVVIVARQGFGAILMKMNNPKKPQVVGRVKDNYAGAVFDVVIREEYLYIADGWDGLEIWKYKPLKYERKEITGMIIIIEVIGGGMLVVQVIIRIRKQRRRG